MSYDVEILNMVKFTDKANGSEKVRIAYRLLDNKTIANSEKFKGYSDLAIYVNSTKPFDLPIEYYGKHVRFYFREDPNPKDPVKKITKLVKIVSDSDKDLCVVE